MTTVHPNYTKVKIASFPCLYYRFIKFTKIDIILDKILSGFSQKSKCLSKSIIFCHHDFHKNRKWHHQCNTDTTKMDHFSGMAIRSCYFVKFWSPLNMCVQILDWVVHFPAHKICISTVRTKLTLLKDQSTIHDADFW